MKSILKAAILIAFTAPVFIFNSHAQVNIPKFQLGFAAGTFVYMGDLTPSALGSYRTLQPTVNLFASKFFSSSFALRANLSLGRLHGDDSRYDHPAYRQQRNFAFSSSLIELSAIGEWNILGRNYISRGFAPYLFGGAGLAFINGRKDWSRLNVAYFGAESELVSNLAVDAPRSIPHVLPVLPVGAGVRYYFSDRIGVSAETSYRLMYSDYLDGFSRSANPGKGDHYQSHTVGIVYRIGKKNTLACPVIQY